MGAVETDRAAPRVTRRRDTFHVEKLTGVVVGVAEHDEGDFVAVFLDFGFDVFVAQADFTFTGTQFDETVGGVVTVKFQL